MEDTWLREKKGDFTSTEGRKEGNKQKILSTHYV